MIPKNKFFLLVFFFIVFSTYNFNEQKQNVSIIFPIKEIIIEGTFVVKLKKLKSELEFLRETSLFFLKEKEIVNITSKYNFISTIQLRKKYPNTLRIIISESIPVVTEINKKKRYYLTKDGKKIDYVKLKAFEYLPIIFGNHKNFAALFNKLEKNNFDIKKIKAFYYFDIGRWDIALKDDRIIKLPEINYEKVLMKINSILNNSSFSKYKVFDYRIKDQLILQ